MKKIVIAALVSSVMTMASCDENSLEPTSTSNDLVSFATTSENTERTKPKLTKVEVDNLPDEVVSYMEENYTGFEVKRAGIDEEGKYHVGLKTTEERKVLIFDTDGTFIESLEIPDRVKGKHPELNEVEPSELPEAILEYITSNFEEATIMRAGTTPEGDFIVGIDLGQNKIGLLFTAEGEFIREMKRPKRGRRP